MVDSCILERWVGDRKSGRKMVMVNDTNLKCFPRLFSPLRCFLIAKPVKSECCIVCGYFKEKKTEVWQGVGVEGEVTGQLMNSSKRLGQRAMSTLLNKFFVRR